MTRKEITDLFKRFLITFLCTLPFLIGLGFLVYGKVSDFVMIVLFVVVAGGVLALEEWIHYKRWKNRQMLREEESKKEQKR